MKIQGGYGPVFQTSVTNKNKTGTSGSDFKDILDQMNTPSEAKASAGIRENGAPVLGGIQIVPELGSKEEISGRDDKKIVIRQLQETLDMIDFYAGKLADSSVEAKDLAPLVGHIDERLETLRDMERSPDVHEGLKPIISDLTLTLGAELERFRQGYYG